MCGDVVEGVLEASDFFGWSLASGDFDEDGAADLAVGVVFEDVSGDDNASAVNVLYGSASGPCGPDQFLHQDIAAFSSFDPTNPFDHFGWSLATGDFGGDGDDDLCIGVEGEDVVTGSFTFTDAGAVNCIYGSSAGLVSTLGGGQIWHQDINVGGVPIQGGSEPNDFLGYSLTTGDYDGSARADLCIGVPYEDTGSTFDNGGINCTYGAPGGLSVTGNEFLNQNIGTILDASESDDHFGTAVSSEVATTAPTETRQSQRDDDAGGVEVEQGHD